MKNWTYSLLIFLLASCAETQPLNTVDRVALDLYEGKWYEIARLPQSFEENCACVTAEYALNEENNVNVKNTCFDTTSNELKVSDGKAFVVDGSNNSKLKVQFFWPFKGDYYIMELDPAYKYAMIGSPNRSYLWILSRTPQLAQSKIETLKQKAIDQGYDLSELIMTDQSCDTD